MEVAGGGDENAAARLIGEIGTLKEVFLSKIEPRARIYLITEYRGQEYMGALLFMDATFCGRIAELLRRQ